MLVTCVHVCVVCCGALKVRCYPELRELFNRRGEFQARCYHNWSTDTRIICGALRGTRWSHYKSEWESTVIATLDSHLQTSLYQFIFSLPETPSVSSSVSCLQIDVSLFVLVWPQRNLIIIGCISSSCQMITFPVNQVLLSSHVKLHFSNVPSSFLCANTCVVMICVSAAVWWTFVVPLSFQLL
jgi:hypothetical protein